MTMAAVGGVSPFLTLRIEPLARVPLYLNIENTFGDLFGAV